MKYDDSVQESKPAECWPCIPATNSNMMFQMKNKNEGWNNLVPTGCNAHVLLYSCANCVKYSDHRLRRRMKSNQSSPFDPKSAPRPQFGKLKY
mmetsp:Transcript_12241/g.22999  ORF Transcript_12241/g.22999 Transcript_12241/m.22999 type:complete len:93 (-) Transcript_12241:1409-1687(-)